MTRSPSAYPVHLIDVVRLTDGSRVLVRPVLPQDAELQRAFVRALSDEARYFRFMTLFKELPDAIAARLTDVDHRSHVALIAEIVTDSCETMIGEARYVVDEREPAVCELALAVAEDWRGMGLARTLLGRLAYHAASSGKRRMVGDAFVINTAMIRFAKRNGFRVVRNAEDARLVRFVKDLTARDRGTSPAQPPIGETAVAA